MDEAVIRCTRGVGIWEWASNGPADREPDVVLACCGDTPTVEVLAAAALLLEHLPSLKVRVINAVDLMRLEPWSEHPHGMTDARPLHQRLEMALLMRILVVNAGSSSLKLRVLSDLDLVASADLPGTADQASVKEAIGSFGPVDTASASCRRNQPWRVSTPRSTPPFPTPPPPTRCLWNGESGGRCVTTDSTGSPTPTSHGEPENSLATHGYPVRIGRPRAHALAGRTRRHSPS
jgi:hypothetical protein